MFGKINKTILPGLILSVGVILFAEALGWRFGSRSILLLLSQEELLAAFTAVLVPLTVLLGYLLNTFLWMTVGKRFRMQVRLTVDQEGYDALRTAILRRRDEGLARLVGRGTGSQASPARGLELYFLPQLTVQHLNHVWESYFSWYEYQMNSAYALLIASVPTCYYLTVILDSPLGSWLLPLGVFSGASLAALALCKAAFENLCAYERSLLVLIAGALEFAGEKKDASAAAPGS